MTTSHTHRGTCQVCGNVQAVNNSTGLLAKHGYTVDYGYFSGECHGSNEFPLEVSDTLTLSTIDRCENRSEKLTELTIADIKDVQIKVPGKRDHRGKREYAIVTCTTTEEMAAAGDRNTFERAAAIKLSNLHSEARHLFAHARALACLILARHGKALYVAADLDALVAAEKAEKAAKPTKASVKRVCEGLNREFSKLWDANRAATYAADVPYYLHQYRAAKHANAFGDDAAKVAELVEKMNEAKASLK